jgi:hypothetical protein
MMDRAIREDAHSRSATRLLHDDGIKRYSVGIRVFIIGVTTPFT